jgi:hypothetical protein
MSDTDSNLYVLEVRDGIILHLNEYTSVADGWHWGTDDRFVSGPFASYELALEAARQHSDRPLNLIVLNADNFFDNEPSPSGNIIVINTDGHIWAARGDAAPKPNRRVKMHRELWGELVRAGVFVSTGEHRPSQKGESQPVYVVASWAREWTTVERLLETKNMSPERRELLRDIFNLVLGKTPPKDDRD